MSSVPSASSAPSSKLSDKIIEDPEHIPADNNIPDNYVAYTLKNQKPLPPITWDNWYKELNWLHFAILAGAPVVGFVGAYHTRLRWETAVWSVAYYYMTGLGKS
jgi:stearoyl-CoA desaturase (delta-9 desaturase)